MSTIAPITGRFRSRIVRDLVGSITLGVALSYVWWHQFHLPAITKWRAFDKIAKAKIQEENAAFLAAQQQVVNESAPVIVEEVVVASETTPKA